MRLIDRTARRCSADAGSAGTRLRIVGVTSCHSYRRYYYEQRLHRRTLVGEAQHARERAGGDHGGLLAELGAARGGGYGLGYPRAAHRC